MIRAHAARRHRTPFRIWAIIAALAAITPAQHIWLAYFPPAGTAPTGLHILDSLFFLQTMRTVENGFFSAYATCQSTYGSQSFHFYNLPSTWLYYAIGAAARATGISDFMALGIANGLGLFAYLWASYRLFLCIVPRFAGLAFTFFSLGGGPGGILYLLTGALGLHQSPQFDAYFLRYAMYGLMEGPFLSPILMAPRLYYTVTLALGFASFTLIIRYVRGASYGALLGSACCLVLGAFLYVRHGPMFWMVIIGYVLSGKLSRRRIHAAATATAAVALGTLLVFFHMRLGSVDAHLAFDRTAMWWSPFLGAAIFLLIPAIPAAIASAKPLPLLPRLASFACMGYIGLYAILYVLYQVYYGNFWLCLDATVAIRMCDWALLGAPIGAAYGWRCKPSALKPAMPGWVALWFVLFCSAAFSALGQGWTLIFLPQRAMAMLGAPLALLAAAGVYRWRTAHPGWVKMAAFCIVGCGICSIAVGALCFQGPLGHRPGQGPYARIHHELMTPIDAEMLARLEPGYVLIPPEGAPRLGDIAALRPGIQTVVGVGTWGLSDQPIFKMLERTQEFFTPGQQAENRATFLREWCVNHVYCPEVPAVNPEVVEELRALPMLEVLAESGHAVLFRVRHEE